MQTNNYKIIIGEDLQELELNVKNACMEGWDPHGSPVVVPQNSNITGLASDYLYFQAMVMYEEE